MLLLFCVRARGCVLARMRTCSSVTFIKSWSTGKSHAQTPKQQSTISHKGADTSLERKADLGGQAHTYRESMQLQLVIPCWFNYTCHRLLPTRARSDPQSPSPSLDRVAVTLSVWTHITALPGLALAVFRWREVANSRETMAGAWDPSGL